MRRHHLIVYLFIAAFICSSIYENALFAQDASDKKITRKQERKARDKYLGLGLGFSHVKIIDQSTSPLMYKGFQFPYLSLGYLTHSKKRIKTVEVDFSFGFLKTRTITPWAEPRNMSFYTNIRYNILYYLRSFATDRINWYIGPEFNINGHFRVNYKYGNSAFTFDNYNGVGIATRIEFPFGWKGRTYRFLGKDRNRNDRDLRISWQLSMPVANLVIRPTYVTITNFVDPELRAKITRDHLNGGFFVPLNLRSQMELYYILQNQNMFRLTYVWNFFHHDPGYNKVQSAFHGVYFAFVFKFNQKNTAQ
jgi:hypothetical protein